MDFGFGFSRICKCWGSFFFLSLCFLDKNLDKLMVSHYVLNISPHLASPVGEGQLLLLLIRH